MSGGIMFSARLELSLLLLMGLSAVQMRAQRDPVLLPNLTLGVLSHIAVGGGWSTVITLVNTSSVAIPVTVALRSDDGSALTLPVTTTQQGVTRTTISASVDATLNPNTTLLISTGDPTASL